MTRAEFALWQQGRIRLLDGATGSNLMKAGLPRGACTEDWVLSHPDVILRLQRAYLDAGSEVIYAPTFGANRVALGHHAMEHRTRELCEKLVALSREAAQGRALVAGDMTTTGKPVDVAGGISYAELEDVYTEQAQALFDAGVDLIVIETMMGLTETAAAVEAVRSVCELPIICTFSVQVDGKLYFDGTVTEAAQTMQELGADAVGINCSCGPDQLDAVIAALKRACSLPLVAKPNAGMPEINDRGEAVYSMDEDAFASAMKLLADAGADLLGGCCGTTPAYIRKLKEIL